MTLPCIVRFVVTALGGFWLGLALGLWRTRALRADVATWRQLATDLHDDNSRLRLGSSSWARRPSRVLAALAAIPEQDLKAWLLDGGEREELGRAELERRESMALRRRS